MRSSFVSGLCLSVLVSSLAACSAVTPVDTSVNSSSSASSVISSAVSSVSADTLTDSGAMRLYKNGTYGYQLLFSKDVSVLPANNGEDIALAIPDSLYAGTVLSSATVSVTSQKDACPAPNYEQQTGKHTEVINSIPFDVTTGTGVGAGNLYESSIYNTVHNGVCHSIVLLRHSCNLGPDCGEGHTKPYNKKAVNEALMSIVRTFAF